MHSYSEHCDFTDGISAWVNRVCQAKADLELIGLDKSPASIASWIIMDASKTKDLPELIYSEWSLWLEFVSLIVADISAATFKPLQFEKSTLISQLHRKEMFQNVAHNTINSSPITSTVIDA